ncbi:uncharacterized protein C8Q71DRAFT_904711 [Rhodofomes roseus]|uniref:FAD-binding domain-containing protein n=1 Tax=Rhodofomes roseus TaxID=34475 RepID=A0ABQ8KRQ9_9APHY|nr:uncharacterized protein C8Q71DRAFT_904711 [Rhodofomes roseus]KAH9840609.1 hypothetical protein C8Q71DRAFT_904711 [Rhodofomes roseus]
MSQQAPLQLHILIVGCGLGGLAAAHCLAQAGHKITLFESAPAIGEVGAGIQVSPNVTRLLIRWGLAEELKKVSVKPEGLVFRRYSDGQKVAYTRWGERMDAFGAPYYHIHRADFHKLLYDRALNEMDLRLNSTVVDCDPEAPSLTLASGEVIHGDLIIGADGIKSRIQKAVLGRENPAHPTGDAAYRATIPASALLADPELESFVKTPEMTGWMGPQRHIMGYLVRGGQLYNLVMLHPDDGSVESWTAEGSADKMRADFADFEPRIQKLLKTVDTTLKWRLMDRKPLETWIHPAGRVALLGDACHPMLPYRAQGAAMAIEDAGVLGNLLSRISNIAQLKPLLYAYESLRLPRTAATQASSRLNQTIFHLPDGPEQEARDFQMRKAMEAELALAERELRGEVISESEMMEGNPNQWADRKKNEAQFGYDADEVAERWWREVGEREIGPLANGVAIQSGRL